MYRVITIKLSPESVAKLDLINQKAKDIRLFDIYKDFYKYYREELIKRYMQAAEETEFAPGSIGRRRRNGSIIRYDSLFGIDTSALFNDLTENVSIDDRQMSIETFIFYAPYLMAKYRQKGPFAPKDVIFATEGDIDALEDVVVDYFESVFDDGSEFA